MKVKRYLLCISIFCLAICTTGCGQALFTMTQEEEDTITLYAAKVVAKFNMNQTTGICNARVREGELDLDTDPQDEEVSDEEEDISSLPIEDVEDEVTETNVENTDVAVDKDLDTAQPVEDLKDEVSEDSSDETKEREKTKVMPDEKVEDVTEEKKQEETVTKSDDSSGYSFTDAIGIEGMEFTCSSFDVCDEYKASSKFVLTQKKDKKYLVLYVDGKNVSGEDITIPKGNKYVLSVDGVEESSINTFVKKDLSYFNGTVKNNSTQSFILVFEFDKSAVEDISSVSLQVTNNGETRDTTI